MAPARVKSMSALAPKLVRPRRGRSSTNRLPGGRARCRSGSAERKRKVEKETMEIKRRRYDDGGFDQRGVRLEKKREQVEY